jgi:threonine synthase
LKAQRWLAEQEGIFCDPASATTLAGLLQLSKRMSFGARDQIVLVITGSGLKTLDDMDMLKVSPQESSLESLANKIETVLS